MSTNPDSMQFVYRIKFRKNKRNYSLIHFNSPWDNSNSRELEDISVMFDGKDLKHNPLPSYKVIKWETLEEGVYESEILMVLWKTKNGYEQLFKLKTLQPGK